MYLLDCGHETGDGRVIAGKRDGEIMLTCTKRAAATYQFLLSLLRRRAPGHCSAAACFVPATLIEANRAYLFQNIDGYFLLDEEEYPTERR